MLMIFTDKKPIGIRVLSRISVQTRCLSRLLKRLFAVMPAKVGIQKSM